jgi:RNA polymerase sigma factor (sigma-70 family)
LNRDPTQAEQARWFEEEVLPHEASLRAWLHRRFPTLTDIDDVVQESFVQTDLARRRGPIASAKAYLFTVGRNISVSLFRRRKFISHVPVNELPPSCVLDKDTDVVETVCSHDEFDLISSAIGELPVRCRQIVALRLVRGMDVAVIARELDISEQTVRVQVARGMKRCVDYLRARGVDRKTER